MHHIITSSHHHTHAHPRTRYAMSGQHHHPRIDLAGMRMQHALNDLAYQHDSARRLTHGMHTWHTHACTMTHTWHTHACTITHTCHTHMAQTHGIHTWHTCTHRERWAPAWSCACPPGCPSASRSLPHCSRALTRGPTLVSIPAPGLGFRVWGLATFESIPASACPRVRVCAGVRVRVRMGKARERASERASGCSDAGIRSSDDAITSSWQGIE
jgi:hypothetical protein